jgi:acyl-CoA synthetase (NDP forming)
VTPLTAAGAVAPPGLLGSGLDVLLAPQSVAVVGVSTGRRGLGYSTLKTIKRFGFSGELIVIHPKAKEISGTPCYPSLQSVPHGVDLALLFTSGEQILPSVADAAAAGVKAVVVFASGFSESGSDGAVRQREIVDLARRSGIRILGPNCQGVVATESGLAATFSNALWVDGLGAAAPVAYIGQSGAIGGSIFDLGRERGCLPAIWVSTGNQADVTVVEMAEHVLERTDVRLLMLYLEHVPHGVEWLRLCERAGKLGKQLVLLRSGTTHAGRHAVASHTGSLVGRDEAFNLLCQENGVITVSDVNEMVDVAMSWVSHELPAGNRLGVVTTSGGAGGLAADLAARAGLRLASLGQHTVTALAEVLSDFATPQNPVDVTADLVASRPHDLERVCAIVAADPEVDHVLVVVSAVVGSTAQAMARSIVEAQIACPGRVSVAYLASHDRTLDVRQILAAGRVPVFSSIRSAVDTLGRLALRSSSVAGSDSAPDKRSGAITDHISAMTEARGARFLEASGMTIPAGELATDRRHAERIAAGLGDDLVLKLQSPQVAHKTELGLVVMGVASEAVGGLYEELVARARMAMPEADVEGVLVQRRASPGVELLVDVQMQDNGYPPLLTVGLGGTAVELYADVATRLLPVDHADALSMLRLLQGYPLLDGFRGAEPLDVDAAAEAIVATARLAELLGDRLIEFEINPLIVHQRGNGATAVDFVAYLRDSDESGGDG